MCVVIACCIAAVGYVVVIYGDDICGVVVIVIKCIEYPHCIVYAVDVVGDDVLMLLLMMLLVSLM